jgi:hypothetical protein
LQAAISGEVDVIGDTFVVIYCHTSRLSVVLKTPALSPKGIRAAPALTRSSFKGQDDEVIVVPIEVDTVPLTGDALRSSIQVDVGTIGIAAIDLATGHGKFDIVIEMIIVDTAA